MAPIRPLLEQRFNTGHLVLQRLVPIDAGVDLHGGVGAWTAHGVHGLMVSLDGLERWFPLALDRCAVGVQLDLEAGVQQHPFAGGGVGGQVDAYPDRNNAEIDDHLHWAMVREWTNGGNSCALWV